MALIWDSIARKTPYSKASEHDDRHNYPTNYPTV